jgi:cell division protein FtsB
MVGILALVFLSIATFKSYRDLEMGRSREAELRQQVRASEARVETLEARVERLREDPATVEQLAREELLMARPGEVVILLPAGPPAGAPESVRAVERATVGETTETSEDGGDR